jgi:hypothetical protein
MRDAERPGSVASVMDQVCLNSPLDVETFISALTMPGWMRESGVGPRG